MIRGKAFIAQVFLLALVIVSCSSSVSNNGELIGAFKGPLTIDSTSGQQLKDTVAINTAFGKMLSIEPTKVGAESIDEYLPLLKGKKVAFVGNQTSVINDVFVVDTLISLGVDLTILFAPEHGFRGDHGAGDHVNHGVDSKTGLKIFSLHGKTKKPTEESLAGVDVILFDIQDVGARFYTYISTLHYVMEAAAEKGIQVIVLDRPNPNANYIDGPILDTAFKSFVGMHPVPVVYGMTIGEYGKMINGEYWLKDSIQANLKVIPLKNWHYKKQYTLPIPPSPNLPNQLSIYLYPSLCFLEATELSLGRGTEFPFQVYGHPGFSPEEDSIFSFKPVSIPEKCKYPKHENKICRGVDLRNEITDSIFNKATLDLVYLIDSREKTVPKKKIIDREDFFNLLAGNSILLNQINSGKFSPEIKKSWEPGLQKFKLVREKYLIYK